MVYGGSVGERNFSVCVVNDLIKSTSCSVLRYIYIFTFVDEIDMQHARGVVACKMYRLGGELNSVVCYRVTSTRGIQY